jgi:hypothetical protein
LDESINLLSQRSALRLIWRRLSKIKLERIFC